jgi:hypothetical protein
MKSNILFTLMSLATISLLAADSAPKDEILTATKKLADQPNYSWRSTVVVPEDARFRPGPTEGKLEKGGITWVSLTMMDNKIEAVTKDDQGAIKQDGEWKSLQDFDKEEGFARMPAMIVRGIKTPAKEAAELASVAKELKAEGDVIAGDLTEDGARKMQRFGPPGGEGPTVSDAKGSVKFWVKDGNLIKYEYKLKGKISFNGNEMTNDRTTTVEIKEVGTTKLDVPETARKKISR